MFLMWIVPLLLIGLVVYAVSSGNKFTNALKPVSSRMCPHCNQTAQSDWKVCPHCGQAL